MNRFASGAALVLALLLTGCHGGQVRLRVSPDSRRHEWRDVISADQFTAPCRKVFYVVEPRVGYAEARRHPLEGYALSARMRWNKITAALCDHFDELRRQHNAASITIQEFDERLTMLQDVLKELSEKKAGLDAAIEQHEAAAQSLEAASSGQGEKVLEQAHQATAQIEDARTRGDAIIAAVSELVNALAPPVAPASEAGQRP